MKKIVLFGLAWAWSSNLLAGTEHYFRRDGGHVQHLKITTLGADTRVSIDADFEPTNAESGRGVKPCSVEIDGEAKIVSPSEVVMRKQIPDEARYCVVQIQLSGDEARMKQSQECEYFAAHFCRFDSEGKVLLRIK